MKNSTIPPIIIKAINPGYTIDGKSNSGEFIELIKLSPEPSFSLAGFSLRYTNSSGNSTILYEFPPDSQMVGETLLFRLSSSPEAELSDLNYTSTLAFKAGPLELVYTPPDGEPQIIDATPTWTFKSASPTALVRNITLDELSNEFIIGDFSHQTDYLPTFDPEKTSITFAGNQGSDESPEPHCKGLQFSEILSFYESSKSEQFIELYNAASDSIDLNGCALRYKNKAYALSGSISPEAYFVYYPADNFTLTKNPNTQNLIELLDVDGSVVDALTYFSGQKKSTSFAQIGFNSDGSEKWLQTFDPTPGSANNYQKYKTCPAGKVINEETGNCVKATNVDTSLAACPDGYTRNPETNRCRKITTNTGAAYELETETFTENSSFIAIGAVIALVAVGLIFIALQFRHEIANFFRKIFKKSQK